MFRGGVLAASHMTPRETRLVAGYCASHGLFARTEQHPKMVAARPCWVRHDGGQAGGGDGDCNGGASGGGDDFDDQDDFICFGYRFLDANQIKDAADVANPINIAINIHREKL